MKALTALIALVSLGAVAPFDGPQSTAQLGSPAVVAPMHAPQESTPAVTLTVEPWFADYPNTTELPGARVYASDPQWVADVEWALEQFRSAGIELPFVEVWAHNELSGCRLRADNETPPAGVYFQRDGVDTVFWCGTRFTLLHELAHVHDKNFLSDSERDRFLAIREADAWSHEIWNRAAGEHFADVMAWGLHNGDIRPSRTMPNDDANLESAFELAMSFAR